MYNRGEKDYDIQHFYRVLPVFTGIYRYLPVFTGIGSDKILYGAVTQVSWRETIDQTLCLEIWIFANIIYKDIDS